MTAKSNQFQSTAKLQNRKNFQHNTDRGKMAESDPYCSICLDKFKDPITTSCNHVFCAHCLKKYQEIHAKEGSFPCPLCNKEIVLAVQGGSGVKRKATDDRDDSDEEILPKCDACWRPMSATSRCIDCSENYCPVCAALHRQFSECEKWAFLVRKKN